jgi:hypothetical protein
MTKRITKPTTAEQRRWLRQNWNVGEPSFREWVAGSDHAHRLVLALLEDVDALITERDAARGLLTEYEALLAQ